MSLARMSEGAPIVGGMTDQMLSTAVGAAGAAPDAAAGAAPGAEERCPRCDAGGVRLVVVEASVAGEAEPSPIFECAECRFEWGEAIGDRLS